MRDACLMCDGEGKNQKDTYPGIHTTDLYSLTMVISTGIHTIYCQKRKSKYKQCHSLITRPSIYTVKRFDLFVSPLVQLTIA